MKPGQQFRFFQKKREGTSNAFTITEMLVAIAVISVLAIFLVIAMKPAKESSLLATCLGNLRQTGVGIRLYASEHNNTLPGPMQAATFFPTYRETPNLEGGDHLYSFIWSYLGLPSPGKGSTLAELGVCPAAMKAGKDLEWLKRSKFFTQSVHRDPAFELRYPIQEELPNGNGYSVNAPFGNGSVSNLPWQISIVSKPGQFALLAETPGSLNNSYSFHRPDGHPFRYGHKDRRCVLFLDGHVESTTAPKNE